MKIYRVYCYESWEPDITLGYYTTLDSAVRKVKRSYLQEKAYWLHEPDDDDKPTLEGDGIDIIFDTKYEQTCIEEIEVIDE